MGMMTMVCSVCNTRAEIPPEKADLPWFCYCKEDPVEMVIENKENENLWKEYAKNAPRPPEGLFADLSSSAESTANWVTDYADAMLKYHRDRFPR